MRDWRRVESRSEGIVVGVLRTLRLAFLSLNQGVGGEPVAMDFCIDKKYQGAIKRVT